MIDLEEFAKANGLPYDPTGTIDMTKTLQAAMRAAYPDQAVQIGAGDFRVDRPIRLHQIWWQRLMRLVRLW